MPETQTPRADRSFARFLTRLRTVARVARHGLPDPNAPADNFSVNRRLWNHYSREWDDPDFKVSRAEDRSPSAPDPLAFDVLGLEWGREQDVRDIIDSWIRPELGSDRVVAEIGPGGGRIAREVVDQVSELHCFDNSSEMLGRLRTTLAGRDNVHYIELMAPGLPADIQARFDFIYAFDVLVHLDLHMLWRYVQDIERALKPGGRAFLHTTNLTTPAGWGRFAEQSAFTVTGHYFITPDVMHTLLSHSSLGPVAESAVEPANFYLNRDYLCLVEKPLRSDQTS